MLGNDDPKEAGKSSYTLVQLGNQIGVEANVYNIHIWLCWSQLDIDVTKCQKSTGQSVLIGLDGVGIEHEFKTPSFLR